MKKKLLSFALFLFAVTSVNAQSIPSNIISPQGGTSKVDNFYLEWTLGDIVATTFAENNDVFTQGFNQVFISVKKPAGNGGKETVNVFASPNPVTSQLNISIETANANQYSAVLLNLHGVKVLQRNSSFHNQPLAIDMRHLASGIYMLQVFDANNRLVNTSKIIKL